MNFIFAKLYEEYKRKNDPAKFNITLYITIVYFFLTFAFVIPIKSILGKDLFYNEIEYGKSIIITVVFLVFGAIVCLVYYFYIRKNYIEILTKKFKDKKINKTILYIIVPLLPLSIFLIAGATAVYINGGEILGHKIHGILK
ncbi:MAG: hypothetical protein AB7O73_13775 [Bacteroidia bacterium]